MTYPSNSRRTQELHGDPLYPSTLDNGGWRDAWAEKIEPHEVPSLVGFDAVDAVLSAVGEHPYTNELPNG